MDRVFEATLVPSKKLCREFGGIATKKNKSLRVVLICSLVMLLILYPFCVFAEIDTVYPLLFGLFLFIYWLFMDRLIGSSTFRNMNKKAKNTSTVYSFDQEGIHIRSELESGDLTYPALEDVVESDGLFALYINKTAAHLIPKDTLTGGTPEEFRGFLGEMTGKPVRTVRKPRLWPKALAAVAMVLLTVLLTVTLPILRDRMNSRPAQFTASPYTITMTQAFEEITPDEGDFFAAESRDVYMWVSCDPADEIFTAWKNRQLTPEDLAYAVAESMDTDQNPTVRVLDSGTACLLFTDVADGETYFYCDAITLGADTFWFTEFICQAADQAAYQTQFVEWSQSIQIES